MKKNRKSAGTFKLMVASIIAIVGCIMFMLSMLNFEKMSMVNVVLFVGVSTVLMVLGVVILIKAAITPKTKKAKKVARRVREDEDDDTDFECVGFWSSNSAGDITVIYLNDEFRKRVNDSGIAIPAKRGDAVPRNVRLLGLDDANKRRGQIEVSFEEASSDSSNAEKESYKAMLAGMTPDELRAWANEKVDKGEINLDD